VAVEGATNAAQNAKKEVKKNQPESVSTTLTPKSLIKALSSTLISDRCREQGWLLKNSLTRNLKKLDRVRKLYKRFFPVSWTFSITRFSTFFRKTDFFNSHRIYQQLFRIGVRRSRFVNAELQIGATQKAKGSGCPEPLAS
jgi:hypothetical protein